MAEQPAAGPFGGRQFIIIFTVISVVVFVFMLIGLRTCSIKPVGAQYTIIYSNLELKDTAGVIVRLKELKIPYRIKDSGGSIAVPKDKADDARVGLAEKGLPLGGAVGWEIFDQTKLGATDFDRRIQFIRALSGELSRTINRISAIEDSRVQIVIPETKLFEASVAPVTASVLLKIREGEALTAKQINGIVNLVASSVENLKKENITIIDVFGNILSSGGFATISPIIGKEKTEEEETITEEKLLIEVKAKKTLEDQLSGKVQSLLNRMYPPNTIIARVNVESLISKKLKIIVLIDEKVEVGRKLKADTIDTITEATDYDKMRGDQIIMKRAPFREAGIENKIGEKPLPKKAAEEVRVKTPFNQAKILGQLKSVDLKMTYAFISRVVQKYGLWRMLIGLGIAFALVSLIISPIFKNKGKEADIKIEKTVAVEEKIDVAKQLEKIREHVDRDPEKAAMVIASWVREEIG